MAAGDPDSLNFDGSDIPTADAALGYGQPIISLSGNNFVATVRPVYGDFNTNLLVMDAVQDDDFADFLTSLGSGAHGAAIARESKSSGTVKVKSI
jgi:hypothetical protein